MTPTGHGNEVPVPLTQKCLEVWRPSPPLARTRVGTAAVIVSGLLLDTAHSARCGGERGGGKVVSGGISVGVPGGCQHEAGEEEDQRACAYQRPQNVSLCIAGHRTISDGLVTVIQAA
jgi:hypothetical protein